MAVAKLAQLSKTKIMVKYIYSMLLLSILLSCNSARKSYITNDNLCHYDDPIFKIYKNELKLNDSISRQLNNNGEELVTIDNENYNNEFYKFEDGEVTNKQTNKRLNVGKWIRYWPNGSIRWVFNLHLNGSKKIFKETQYDKNGEITQVINYEKGYNICYAEAIAIVKKVARHKIEKYQITEFFAAHNNLNEFPDVKPVWYIGLSKGNEKYENGYYTKGQIRYRIDGVTGRVLKKYRFGGWKKQK